MRGAGTTTTAPGPAPVFSAVQPWLDKIKDPALACMTAQTVAAGMSRFYASVISSSAVLRDFQVVSGRIPIVPLQQSSA